MCLRNEGFTLIELVLGLTISGLILVILFAALTLGQRSEEKGLKQEEETQRMRVLADRLSWLISGAYPYLVEKQEGKLLYFSGSRDGVGFVTTSVDPFSENIEDRPGLKWVRIYADDNGLKIAEKIYYGEDVFEKQGGKEYIFDSLVREIRFEYLSVDEEKKTMTWGGSWKPEEREVLPNAVKVSLTFEAGGKAIKMPPFTVSIRASHGIKIPPVK